MVYHGHVRNGKIELDEPVTLPEGAPVTLTVGTDPHAAPHDRPIEVILEEIGASIPESEWAKLPPDFSDQIDHYVYGTRKR